MSSRIVRVIATILALVAIGGCAGTATEQAPTTSLAASPMDAPSAPASAAAPSAEPSSAAPSTATGTGTLCAKGFETCPIPAGTYSSAPFEHPFTFTISGDDWTNDRNWVHGGSMTKAGANSFLWASGVVSGQVGGTAVEIGPMPADFIAHLRKFDGFTVSEPVPVTVDGVSGSQVDVLSNDIGAGGMFLLPEDGFNLSPGEKTRFLVLNKDGATVILFVESFKAATFDAFMADVAQPLLDGLTWQ
jgi:hypothetical protein